MQAAAAQWQLSAPISLPVQQYINRINWNAQSGIVAKSYKELVFFAVPLDSSSTNNATLVYNTRLQRWLGCWLGWTPTAFCKSRFGSIENLLISDTAGYVNYWKDADDSNNPATYFDRLAPVAWKIWPRALRFNDPVCTKTAYNCVLRFTAGNATANISAVLDLVSAKSFTEIFTAEGDKLGVGKLGSFRLASVKPIKVEQSLRSLPSFSEMYLRIEGTSGWIKLRNFTVSAFLNAIEG